MFLAAANDKRDDQASDATWIDTVDFSAGQANARREEHLCRGAPGLRDQVCVRAVRHRPDDAGTRRQRPEPAAQSRTADSVLLAAVEPTRPPINRAALSS